MTLSARTLATFTLGLLGCSAPARPPEPTDAPVKVAPAEIAPAAPPAEEAEPRRAPSRFPELIPVEASLPFRVDARCEDHGEQLVPGYGDGVRGSRTTTFSSVSYRGECLKSGRGRLFVLRVVPGPEADHLRYTATFVGARGERLSGAIPLRGSWTIVFSGDVPPARVVLDPGY